jgi:hypothetical protein
MRWKQGLVYAPEPVRACEEPRQEASPAKDFLFCHHKAAKNTQGEMTVVELDEG